MLTRRADSSETSDAPSGLLGGHHRRAQLIGAVALLVAGAVALAACNSHPVEYADLRGDFEKEIDATGASSAALDLLFVIDNSQSMCQEQNALGSQFESIVSTLEERNANFHVAVTTTQPKNPRIKGVISKHGHIQSQPLMRIATDSDCWYKYNEQGVPQNPSNSGTQWGDFQPVRNQIQKALNCAKNPEQKKMEWKNRGLYAVDGDGTPTEPSDVKIACATGDSSACNAMSDSQLANELQGDLDALVPTPFVDTDQKESAYRDIPKVLQASAYRQPDGSLNAEELRQDFACMSFVGLYGSIMESGLRAARTAVSPKLTGGAADLPKDEQGAIDPDDDGESEYGEGPNHGFLRKDARFGLVFVTDENDCSHDQSVDVSPNTGCGDSVCYFPAKNEPGNQAPLLETSDLRDQFMSNLRKSKAMSKEEFEAYKQNIYVASIHGEVDKETISNPPDGVSPTNPDEFQMACMGAGGTQQFKSPSCSTQFGLAYTGDRYQDFLLGFPEGNRFPQTTKDDGNLTAFVCEGTLSSAFEAIKTIIPKQESGCILESIRPCDRNNDGENDCPEYQFGSASSGGGMLCQDYGKTDRDFCDSSIRVELDASGFENPEQVLRQRGYCIDESINGTQALQQKCVVKRSKYRLADCGDSGIRFLWNKPQEAQSRTSGMKITIRLHQVEPGEEEPQPDAMTMQ